VTAALLTILVSSFVIALSGAMMPGPLMTATIGESARLGFVTGPLLVTGHALLEAALIAALFLGLAPLMGSGAFFAFTALVGAAILLWMAVGMFRSLPGLQLSTAQGPVMRHHPVVSGILLSLANPYWFIWWATVGTGYILYASRYGPPGVAAFFTGHILADLAWYSLLSAAVAGGRRFLSDGLYRGVIAFCASFLAVFACFFAWAGIDKVRHLAFLP